MKNSIKIITVLFLTIISISCSKDDDSTPPTVYESEDFYDGFITKAGLFSGSTVTGNPDFFEIGLVFKPLVTGKITQLRINIPTIQTPTLVTLWDKSTKTKIKSVNCGTIGISEDTPFDINDIVLVKNKEYVISMNVSKYFYGF